MMGMTYRFQCDECELAKENEQLKTLITMAGYTIKNNNGELSLEFKSKLW